MSSSINIFEVLTFITYTFIKLDMVTAVDYWGEAAVLASIRKEIQKAVENIKVNNSNNI